MAGTRSGWYMANVIGPTFPVLIGFTQSTRAALLQSSYVESQIVLVGGGESLPVAFFKGFLAVTLLCFLVSLAIGLFQVLRSGHKSNGDDPKEAPAPTQDVARNVPPSPSPPHKNEAPLGAVLVSDCASCGRPICLEKKVPDSAENSGENRFIQCPHCVCMIDLLQTPAAHRPPSGETRIHAVECPGCGRRNVISREMMPAPGNSLHQDVLHCVFCTDAIDTDVLREIFASTAET